MMDQIEVSGEKVLWRDGGEAVEGHAPDRGHRHHRRRQRLLARVTCPTPHPPTPRARRRATTHPRQPALTDTLRALAAASPGAAGLFRQSGLSFCCGGARTVAQAAAETGRDPQALLAEIAALAATADCAAPAETGALITHIETRPHAVHRAKLVPWPRRSSASTATTPRRRSALPICCGPWRLRWTSIWPRRNRSCSR